MRLICNKSCLDIKSRKNFEEVKTLIENCIDYYNNERSQWNLNKMTPAELRCHLLSFPLMNCHRDFSTAQLLGHSSKRSFLEDSYKIGRTL